MSDRVRPVEVWPRLVWWLTRHRWPVKSVNVPLPWDAYGMTDFESHAVYLQTRLDTRQQAETLLHEAGHVLLHPYLARDGATDEEATVETVAVVLTWEAWGWYDRHPLASRPVTAPIRQSWSPTTQLAFDALQAVGEGRQPPEAVDGLFANTDRWIRRHWRHGPGDVPEAVP
jgi:hypothetical protein